MKKSIFILFAFFCFALVSCLDTEEKITLNADDTGIYFLNMDMSSMMDQLKLLAFQKEEIAKALEKKDTTIQFRSFSDTSSALTDQEKELLRDGSFTVQVNSEENLMKVSFTVPFKNTTDLVYLKQHLPDMIAKVKATGALMGENSGNTPMGNHADPGKLLNPAAQAFAFSSQPGSLAYRLVDKSAIDNIFAKDSTMQMIKQVLPMMGDVNYKTTLIIPRPVKTYNGNNAVLSTDKKTVTFTNSLSEVLQKPELFEYKVDY